MKTKFSLTRRRVRFECERCPTVTHWFYVRRLRELGETVESWRAWWIGLHDDVASKRGLHQ